MKSGIYRIDNIKTNKSLVGSSVSLSRRLSKHIKTLRRGTHTNSNIQKDYDEYGLEYFTWEILESCERGNLSECELKWILYYKELYGVFNKTLNTHRYCDYIDTKNESTPYTIEYLDREVDDIVHMPSKTSACKKLGYKCLTPGDGTRFLKTKNHILHRGHIIPITKKVYLKNKAGEVVETYKSLYHLCYKYSVCKSAARKVLNKSNYTFKTDYILSDNTEVTPYSPPQYTWRESKTIEAIERKGKPIYSVDSEGNKKFYPSISTAAKIFGTQKAKQSISEAVNGIRTKTTNPRNYRGLLWYPQ